ncbi:MAG TPA: DUF423 domain-containing protein [Casimicrobiaceae bacterium]|jgi:uncharacterized membrane protein YgdD (TMEM256/DUF423 family)|nr:DUF423 domain-containing protein [Casimicrobiaceae bacterium]
MTARFALVAGSLFMALAVALGAFGAHALKARLAPEMLAIWHTGVTYHAWHALALILLGLLMLHATDSAALRYAAWLFVAGIVLFGGSLYLLALGAPRWFGAITPFGGVAFIVGWILTAAGAWTMRS